MVKSKLPTFCSFCGVKMIMKEFTFVERSKLKFVCYCESCYEIDYPSFYAPQVPESYLVQRYDLDGRPLNKILP